MFLVYHCSGLLETLEFPDVQFQPRNVMVFSESDPIRTGTKFLELRNSKSKFFEFLKSSKFEILEAQNFEIRNLDLL